MTNPPATVMDPRTLEMVAARWREIAPPTAAAVARVAPSTHGELHLGHVAHMAWLCASAEVTGARVIVRMEDHDRSRCRPEHERAILHDLAWLGFTPEPMSLRSLDGHPSPYRQSDHPERYQEAFDALQERGLLYGCSCTRGDLPPPDDDGGRRYPGTCRGQPVEREGRHVVRVMLPDDVTRIDDLLLGPNVQRPGTEHGDPVVRDALGQWTYQFCVAIDDMIDGVNLIVRGDDLRSSTGRQWLLARLLGRTTPFVTAHHPLLLGDDGRKLSKRDGSLAIRALRERGMTPGEVVAEAVG